MLIRYYLDSESYLYIGLDTLPRFTFQGNQKKQSEVLCLHIEAKCLHSAGVERKKALLGCCAG